MKVNMDFVFFPVCHGVMNALISAKWTGFNDCSVYCTHYPCNECKKIVLQYKIENVYYTTEKDCDGNLVDQNEKLKNIE